MHHQPEKSVTLPGLTVELATITWEQRGESPRHDTHALFQRLSRDHSPLRLGHRGAFDMLPRVRSVGFIAAGATVPLVPIERPLRVLTCFFDPEFVERHTGVAPDVWTQNAAALAVLRNKRVEILMQELLAELEEPGLSHAFLVQSLAGVMLVELARHVRQIDRRRSRSGIVLALAPWQLKRIEERILGASALGYPSLAELAELCGVSQGHLARSFKATTGWQIQKYIAELRVATAAELLRQGELSCEAVAARLGYASPGYFSTVFRRMTGTSPSEVRRQALGAHRRTPQIPLS